MDGFVFRPMYKDIFSCSICKKQSTYKSDFLYFNTLCNGCRFPPYHCGKCGLDSKSSSDFLHSKRTCNKCFK